MRVDIDLLMIVLLIAFIGSFTALIIYGEVWRIRLPTTETNLEAFDRERTQNAFILSCVSIVSGASIMYLLETRFSIDGKNEKRV
jgi:hypothetical membrane protein